MTLYTKREACEILKVSPRTLDRILQSGELAFYRISGSIRIEDSDLEGYLRKNRTLVQPMISHCPVHGKKQVKRERVQYVPGMKVVG